MNFLRPLLGRSRGVFGFASLACAALLGAGLVASCSTVRIETDGDLRLEPGTTYRWVQSDGLNVNRQGLQGEVPWSELRAALSRRMQERGLMEVASPEAQVTAQMTLDFDIVTRENDPYFDFYVASRYERATLRLILREGQEHMWVGKDSRRLRYVEQMQGSMVTPSWIDVDEEREWDVEDFVDGLIAALPMRD